MGIIMAQSMIDLSNLNSECLYDEIIMNMYMKLSYFELFFLFCFTYAHPTIRIIFT